MAASLIIGSFTTTHSESCREREKTIELGMGATPPRLLGEVIGEESSSHPPQTGIAHPTSSSGLNQLQISSLIFLFSRHCSVLLVGRQQHSCCPP